MMNFATMISSNIFSRALIGIDFHPQRVEKMNPPCIARLDLANCKEEEMKKIVKNENIVLTSYSEALCSVCQPYQTEPLYIKRNEEYSQNQQYLPDPLF